MAATNFCEVYDCRTTEFFSIDRFSDTTIPYTFKFQNGWNIDEMNYNSSDGYWQGEATNNSVTPGYGFPLDTNGDGTVDTQIYKLAQTDNVSPYSDVEFCHSGLGCTGFGTGTGIILPARAGGDAEPEYEYIPIPIQITDNGAPIYSDEYDEFLGDGDSGGGMECFIPEAKVLMFDGTFKEIKDVVIGDKVQGVNGINVVINTPRFKIGKSKLHGFNGLSPFVTSMHPIKTDKGWASFNPELYKKNWPEDYKKVAVLNNSNTVLKLNMDANIAFWDNDNIQYKLITNYIEEEKNSNFNVYNLSLDGDNTFIVEGIVVHNKHIDGHGNNEEENEDYETLWGCFIEGADNYTVCPPNTNCYQKNPPHENACKWDGKFHADEIEQYQYTQPINTLCCIPGTQDGTLASSGETSFSNPEDLTVNVNYFKGDTEENTGNVYNADACNKVDCSIQEIIEFANEDFLIPKVHFNGQCVNSLGTHGKFGHNIVFDYYYNTVLENFEYNEESGEGDVVNPSLYHYPFVRTRYDYDDSAENNAIEYIDDMENELRYFEPINNSSVNDNDDWRDFNDGLNNSDSQFDTDTIEFQNGLSSIVFDRFQIGTDVEGNELYDLPIYRELSCQDIEDDADIVVGDYTGKREDYDLGKGFTKSPFTSERISDVFTETYTLGDSHSKGLDFCGGMGLVNEAFQIFFDNPIYFRVIMNIFAQYSADIWFDDINENTELPNSTNGFGLNSSGVEEIITTEDAEEYIKDTFSNNQNLNRDVLIRIGFPLPPISFNEMDCDNVRESYLQLVDEFIGEVVQITFFQDFKLTGVDIEPTMKNKLDVLSGIDLREENLNACDYIEFMTLPGGSAMGDGNYYTGIDIPSIYFEAPYDNNVGNTTLNDMTKENYVRTFDCNTELNNNLQFSKIRAMCKDGSSVEMAYAGSNGNQSYIINGGIENSNDVFFNTGVEACNSQLKLNSNQDLYYLSDNDGKESLGIFFYENENKTNENFINDKDESFNQYSLLNGVSNGNGKDIQYIYQEASFSPFGKLFIAENWNIIRSKSHDDDFPTSDNYRSNRIAPYWRATYSECFSLNRCIVVDTLKPLTNQNFSYDTRQGITTFIKKENLSEITQRKNQKFKLSFMMKTIEIDDGVDLKDTGIHTILEFDNSKVSSDNETFADSKIKTKKYKTSQCSPNGKNENHYSSKLTEERYCTETRASFTNTKMNKWEKMEYVFEVHKDVNLTVYNGVNLYLTPLEFARMEYDLYPEIQDYDSIQNYMENNASIILVDNVEFKEAYDFHPDVDVRKKKGPNDYGLVSLTEYYDKFKPTADIEEFNDTTAPLEVQFYFYPRFPYDDVLSPNREILLEKFEFKQFFISDIDWGDGSPIEFDTDPKKIGTDIALYHTYEQGGTYEIKGTMFTTVPELYTPSATPTNINYGGNLGVGYNQKFTIKININEGTDEDFKYFGSDGFSFIPYKNPTPVIGGTSKQSIYYKSLKRNLGIVDGAVINNLLLEDDLVTKDFHAYNGTDLANSSAIEVTLGGEDGWYQTFIINPSSGNTNTEFLMSNNVSVIPNTTYVESFELKHDGTLDSLNITFFNSLNGHRLVDATIEDLGIDNDGNFHKRISAEFTTAVDDTTIRAIDFRDVSGTLSFLAVKNIAFYLPTPDLDVTLVDVNYSRQSDRLKTEMAFQKIDSLYNDSGAFDLLNYYQQPANNTFNVSPEYLSTLPFPRYFQEFDILNINGLTYETAQEWTTFGRPDIADVVYQNLTDNPLPRDVEDFYGQQFEETNAEFVATLPFPRYLEEFDINGDGDLNIVADSGDDGDLSLWVMGPAYRGDVSDMLFNLLLNISIEESGLDNYYTFPDYAFSWNSLSDIPNYVEDTDGNGNTLPVLSESDTYNLPEVYINPTLQSQNEQYTGQQYSSLTEQLGKSIGDVDLSIPKYYNKPKSIWEFFGFENENTSSIGTPSNLKYWKNIIPKDYSIYNREGLDGDLIDIYSEQEWFDNYYYPVLPRYGQDGKFIEGNYPNDKVPFPLEGIITNNKQEDENILIGLSSETNDINVLNDNGGKNNKGFIISDFKPKFQNDTLEIKKTKKTNKLKKSSKNRAF